MAEAKQIPFTKSKYAFIGDVFVSRADGRRFTFHHYKTSGKVKDSGLILVEMWVTVADKDNNFIANKSIATDVFDAQVQNGKLVKDGNGNK